MREREREKTKIHFRKPSSNFVLRICLSCLTQNLFLSLSLLLCMSSGRITYVFEVLPVACVHTHRHTGMRLNRSRAIYRVRRQTYLPESSLDWQPPPQVFNSRRSSHLLGYFNSQRWSLRLDCLSVCFHMPMTP